MIYIVKGTKGSWDSHYDFIVGIYDSIDLAEKEKVNFIEELNILSKKYNVSEKDSLERELRKYMEEMEEDEKFLENIPKHLLEYRDWPFRYKMESFNLDEIKIETYILNTRHFKIEDAI